MFYNTKLIFFCALFVSQITNCATWTVDDLSVGIINQEMKINIGSLVLPFVEDPIQEIAYRCKAAKEVYPKHHCGNGQISFKYKGIVYQLMVSGWVNLPEKKWHLVVKDKDNFIQVSIDSENHEKFVLEIKKVPTIDLVRFLKPYFFVDDLFIDGLLSAHVEIDFSQALTITADYSVDGLTWESPDSQYVIAESQHQGQIKLVQISSGLKLTIDNNITNGEALIKDIYLSFDDSPVLLSSVLFFDNQMNPNSAKMIINATNDIKFSVDLKNWSDNHLKINFRIKNLSTFNDIFLVSYLELLGIDDLIVSGESNGVIQIRNNKINSVEITINQMDLSIESKKMQMNKLSSHLKWQDFGGYQFSKIKWGGLLLAGMPIKESEISFSSVGQKLILEGNTILPIFDGSLFINELILQDVFEPQIAIKFDGLVNPISIALITQKMGWPRMTGTLSGKIPGMKKIGRSITFDGSLDVNVFGGKMQINNLSTERLFGIAPVIAGDISFQNLNLQQITSTFDFGEITGLIDGYINDLRVTNWKADRLDAHIHSVKSNGVKQTISQRAIDNISSIGGIQGALSRSFLRFFDYFKYKNIGIGCKLRNSICEMSGINATNNTYQIIQGKGIPSIHINGFRRFIDWEIFLDRLLNAGYD